MSSPLPPAPPPDLRARVLAAVASEPVAARAAGARARVRALAIGFGVTIGLFAWTGGPQTRGRPSGFVAALFLVWLPIAALATWAGVSRGRSMLGRPVAWRIAAAVATPIALWATWAVVATAWPSTLEDPSGPVDLVVCNVMTLVLAMGPLIAFGVIRRGSDPVNPRVSALGIGVAAGSWAAVVLSLVCRHTAALHLAIGHVLPVAVVTLLGLALTRVVAIRAKTR